MAGLSDGGAHVGTICDVSFPDVAAAAAVVGGRPPDRSPADRAPGARGAEDGAKCQARRWACSTADSLAPGYQSNVNVMDFDRLCLPPEEFTYTRHLVAARNRAGESKKKTGRLIQPEPDPGLRPTARPRLGQQRKRSRCSRNIGHGADQKDVVAARQRHELATGDQRRGPSRAVESGTRQSSAGVPDTAASGHCTHVGAIDVTSMRENVSRKRTTLRGAAAAR